MAGGRYPAMKLNEILKNITASKEIFYGKRLEKNLYRH